MRAKKHLGQHWLSDRRYAERVVESVGVAPTDLVVEIGPGPGAITGLLAPLAGHTLAIEVDPRMREPLERRYGTERFTFLLADVMSLDLAEAVAGVQSRHPELDRVRLVANLPYYISSPVILRLIAHRRVFHDVTVMLQREVVDRLTASPGGKDYGSLTVLVAMYFEAVKSFDVPPGAFTPAPKVHSSVVRLRVLSHPAVEVPDEKQFFKIVRASFARRRKTLENNLRVIGLGGLARRAGIDPVRRAETLALEEFAALARSVEEMPVLSPEC